MVRKWNKKNVTLVGLRRVFNISNNIHWSFCPCFWTFWTQALNETSTKHQKNNAIPHTAAQFRSHVFLDRITVVAAVRIPRVGRLEQARGNDVTRNHWRFPGTCDVSCPCLGCRRRQATRGFPPLPYKYLDRGTPNGYFSLYHQPQLLSAGLRNVPVYVWSSLSLPPATLTTSLYQTSTALKYNNIFLSHEYNAEI